MRPLVHTLPLKLTLLPLLALLLVLGPFLHGHLGTSHVQGFHLDGLHVVAADHPAGVMQQASFGNDESPALGVARSLPKTDDEGLGDVLAAAVLLLLLCRLLPLVTPGRRPPGVAPRAACRYAPGSPPPALAPPVLTA